MAQRTRVNIEEIEKYYRIEEDGAIWSYRQKQYVRQTLNMPGYAYVSIRPVSGMTSVHKMVAQKYLGDCPRGCEISHKDGNKLNNHWTNLEYITHSENQLKAFREHGRELPPGNRHSPSVETKLLMSQAKKKPVYCSDGRQWKSVEECAKAIGKTRVSIYESIRDGFELRGVGGMLGYSIPVAEARPREKKPSRKEKRVYCSNGRVWDSIQKCADDTGVNRKTVYNRIRRGEYGFCSPDLAK